VTTERGPAGTEATADPDDGQYRYFTREQWGRLAAAAPATLSSAELRELAGDDEPESPDELAQIYVPLSRLLSLYVTSTQALRRATNTFLGTTDPPVPFVIGIAGSVAVGKTTTARVLRALLSRWPDHPNVDLITTDGFLLPNSELEARHLTMRKGFPGSYDTDALLTFLTAVKTGHPEVHAPVYSHRTYDIAPGEVQVVRQPDIMLVEGVNVLQDAGSTGSTRTETASTSSLSNIVDFSLYIDADEVDIRRWYVARFLTLKSKAGNDPDSFFAQWAHWPDSDASDLAHQIWDLINGVNLRDHILPTRERATLIVTKGPDHTVHDIRVRRL
jgi:type I pantothenate kinase